MHNKGFVSLIIIWNWVAVKKQEGKILKGYEYFSQTFETPRKEHLNEKGSRSDWECQTDTL